MILSAQIHIHLGYLGYQILNSLHCQMKHHPPQQQAHMLVQPLPVPPPTANTPIIMARVNTVVINLFSVFLIELSPSYSFLLFLFSFTKIIDSILPSGIFINNRFGTNRHVLGRIDIRKAGGDTIRCISPAIFRNTASMLSLHQNCSL